MKKGFTLSEVMLVLSVIGVIAALTIPGIMQNTQNKQTVTRLKKEYSTLQQAFTALVADNEGDSSFLYDNTDNGRTLMNVFATKLIILKNCGSGTGCWTGKRKTLNGVDYDGISIDSSWNGDYGKVILADGATMMLFNYNSNCTTNGDKCGEISIDINGAAGPNVIGRDFFKFWIMNTGILPHGISGDGFSCSTSPGTQVSSFGCTNKVLTENAVNY